MPALNGVVAQLVEHHNGIVGVRGSNPLGSTILKRSVNAHEVWYTLPGVWYTFGGFEGGGKGGFKRVSPWPRTQVTRTIENHPAA